MAGQTVTDTDVVVVGAGPAGLYQAFQLGLLGLRVEVIDALHEAGGQCATLYADKPIYDIPGIPACTGRALTDSLLAQARPFVDGHLHLGVLMSALTTDPEGRLRVSTCSPLQPDVEGPVLNCRGLVIATGAGAFLPRSLAVPGLMDLANVHHDFAVPERWAGQPLEIGRAHV